MPRRLMTSLAFGLAACIAALPGAAHHRTVVNNGIRVAADPTQDCECRARGNAYTVGEQICLNGRVATCAMDQNVTTWRSTSKTCPQS
jgi:hypothetical protein